MNCHTLIHHMSSEKLSDAIRADIFDAGKTVVPHLIDILQDKAAWEEDRAGAGWASMHAATLLGEMGAVEAIQPLLQTLAEVEWETCLANAVTNALAEMGPIVVEPVLRAYEQADDDDLRFSLCEVLTCCGSQDERIFTLLCEFFAQDADLGATLLSIYGDARALPLLQNKLAAYEAEHPNGPWVSDDLPSELAASIVELGGTLSPDQEQKLQAVLEVKATPHDSDATDNDDAVAASPSS